MQKASSKSQNSIIGDHAAIAAGAMLGVSGRWLISISFNTHAAFPFATLIINLIGCFVIGAVQTGLRVYPAQRLKLILVVGILSGFTTFSTFSIETVRLLQAQQVFTALVYQGLTIGAGLGAVVIGSAMMHRLVRRR